MKLEKASVMGLGAALCLAAITSAPAVQVLAEHRSMETGILLPYPFGTIPVRIDPLSAWFILIINLTCINSAVYGMGYLRKYVQQKTNLMLHWSSFILFQASMLGVCVLQHGLAFLVAWEIMSISSFLLVIFEHGIPGTLKAGINYLVQMHIGAAFLSIAFIAVYSREGSFDFVAIDAWFTHHPPDWIFLLFFLGFGIKAGFIPLQTWLPHAHPAAPSHVSGAMSGVIVKLGIFGILRMISFLHSGFMGIGEAILVLSMLTALYGILNAAVHRDVKRMLAFCTIENIGLIGMGIGIGLIGKASGNAAIFYIGFLAALLHTLNHSLYKSLLFFSAGNIYQQTHTRDMDRLGGLMRRMPQTALLFLCGSLAICALPPFNGFVSEFLLYSGFSEGLKAAGVQMNLLMVAGIAALAMVGGLSLFTFTKTFGVIFLGTPRTPVVERAVEVSGLMRMPLYVISAIMLFIGFFPNALIGMLLPVAGVLDAGGHVGNYTPYSLLGWTGPLFGVLVGVVLVIYYVRTRFASRMPARVLSTWGCGYTAPNSRMQYTGKSFAKSLAKLFSYFTAETKKYAEITGIFPEGRSYRSHYGDFFEGRIFGWAKNRLLAAIDYFGFIQTGQTQRYVLYGLFFMIVIIISTFLNML